MSIRKKGGIRLAEAEDDSDESVSNDINDEEMRIKQQKEEAARKAKEEELWASFKKDTGLKAAAKPTSSSKAVRLKVFCLFLFDRLQGSLHTSCALIVPSNTMWALNFKTLLTIKLLHSLLLSIIITRATNEV